VQLTAGGGISRIEEVLDLRDVGANGVLIGSALHDGRIGIRELEQIAAIGH
jgi:phosphoribosylformimino-5-aminoimidazole carboxamide ribotide isomerase